MPISIRLPAAIEARLASLAAATGRSKTWYVTEAVCEHLDDLEDLYLAEQRLIELRANHSRISTLDEVMKRYGLEG
ncbi:MAG: TraY domain-containing protein [Xanthomonadaceae bacterium]|nr:TraY domain-containing protein [Xanthomonadaceae bacterium]MDP2186769.1 TraY domain-containing protein [Xanthomonadales bacterium]MDZ4115342.1 TraY domain-containing protein [Xanthomonadaceae bacterium]MDZ4379672.1 TraY domain-containing protein [Xanthomonadaceae bacterium]